eukprot:TRINITY_DN8767_c0_g2_i1.p1 TRINITY_DN8767_c0_g2~~TRINITY_DN8767_c0_g2_i1.p1  ORF type:complete len:173 (-),score=20.27 TRINITY_DN8767_c0_g2_i1:127-645(-)
MKHQGLLPEFIKLPDLENESSLTGELCLIDFEEEKYPSSISLPSTSLLLGEKHACCKDPLLLDVDEPSIPDEFSQPEDPKMSSRSTLAASAAGSDGTTSQICSTYGKSRKISLLEYLDPSPFSVFINQASIIDFLCAKKKKKKKKKKNPSSYPPLLYYFCPSTHHFQKQKQQ